MISDASRVKPFLFNRFPAITAAESTRLGGASSQPYHSLNLGLNTKDDLSTVRINRKHFFESLGFASDKVAASYQCHSDQIQLVKQPGELNGFDALITNIPGIMLAVTIADCTPILVYHPPSSSIAAIHAGWRGTVAQIVAKTILKMSSEFGSNPSECFAYIGTCIDVDYFEVGIEVAEQFSEKHKVWNPTTQKFHVDLKKANRDQLIQMGLKEAQIQISPFCTVKNNDRYFSHRKEKGVTGRMLAVIGLHETE